MPDSNPASNPESLTVEVILAEPQHCQRLQLRLTQGTTARETLLKAVDKGLDITRSGVDPNQAPLGVYALKVSDEYVMNEGDRLEVYRPLQQDPMELRRQRAQRDAQSNAQSNSNRRKR